MGLIIHPVYTRIPIISTFSPLDISDCILWLDSDMGITTVDGKVSAWADQSGTGNNFVQSNPTKRFTHTADQLNGHAALVNAGGAYLTNSSPVSMTDLTKFSLFVVVMPSSAGYVFNTAPNNGFGFDCTGLRWQCGFGILTHHNMGASLLSQTVILCGLYDGTQATNVGKLREYISGLRVPAAFWEAPPASWSATSAIIGAHNNLSDSCAGNYYSFILYNKLVNSTEYKQIYDYLANRYAQTLYYSINPAMTSNTAPSPLVAAATTEFYGYDAYHAFDYNNDAVWSSNGAPSEGSPQNLWIDLGTATEITAYNLLGAGAYCPKDWILQGSNNGSDWTNLHTVNDDINTVIKYGFPGHEVSTTYRYYRIYCTESVNGSNNALCWFSLTGPGAPIL